MSQRLSISWPGETDVPSGTVISSRKVKSLLHDGVGVEIGIGVLAVVGEGAAGIFVRMGAGATAIVGGRNT